MWKPISECPKIPDKPYLLGWSNGKNTVMIAEWKDGGYWAEWLSGCFYGLLVPKGEYGPTHYQEIDTENFQ